MMGKLLIDIIFTRGKGSFMCLVILQNTFLLITVVFYSVAGINSGS